MLKVSINKVVKDFDILKDHAWGYYDWFCPKAGLERRARSYIAKLKFLVKEELLDGDSNYVWFKNNAPFYGPTYDDMRISSLSEENEFLGGLSAAGPRGAEIWWFEINEEGKREVVSHKANGWSALKNELKENEELRAKIKARWNV